MPTNNEMFRLTIDIPEMDHRKLKTWAAASGKSMREMIAGWIHNKLNSKHVPNAETLKVMEQIEQGKNLHKAKDIDDMFRQIGI